MWSAFHEPDAGIFVPTGPQEHGFAMQMMPLGAQATTRGESVEISLDDHRPQRKSKNQNHTPMEDY
jgi:hypothetical protein